MTPFLRLSASLSLTLLVWGPNAIDELGNGSVDLGDLALRFVVTFAFFRVSVWGVGQLFDSYRSAGPMSRDVVRISPPPRIPVDDSSLSRRATDRAPGATPEREQPGLPAASLR